MNASPKKKALSGKRSACIVPRGIFWLTSPAALMRARSASIFSARPGSNASAFSARPSQRTGQLAGPKLFSRVCSHVSGLREFYSRGFLSRSPCRSLYPSHRRGRTATGEKEEPRKLHSRIAKASFWMGQVPRRSPTAREPVHLAFVTSF